MSMMFLLLYRNDNDPKFTQKVYQVGVSEDIAIQQEVITVTATDLDENDALTYSITNGGRFLSCSNN